MGCAVISRDKGGKGAGEDGEGLICINVVPPVEGEDGGAGKGAVQRLEDVKKRRASTKVLQGAGEALDEDLAMPSPRAGGSKSPMSPRAGLRKRRISGVITEFSDTFQGYMENRDHPFLGEDRLRRLFGLIDVDQSGTLELSEVQDFWKRMGWAHTENSIKTMFTLADKDSSGGIDFDEFATFFKRLSSVDELQPDPDHEDWVPPSQRKKERPRGRVWEPGARPVRSYRVQHHLGHPSRVKCLAVDPTRSLYAACGRDDVVMRLYDLQSGNEHRAFTSHQDTVVCVALSPDRKHLATASRDGMLILWDSVSGVVIEQLDHPGVVTSCTFSPDEGKYVVSGCQDSICRKYQVSKGRMVHQSEKLGRGVVVTAIYADKILAVALSREKAVQLLDAKTLRCRWVLRGHATMVWSVGSSSDSKHIMSACEQFIKVWEASTLKLLQCFPVHTRDQSAAQEGSTPPLAPQGSTASLSSGGGGALAAPARAQPPPKPEEARWITACYGPADFNHFVCAVCSDKSMYFFNTVTGLLVLTLPTRAPVYCLAASQEQAEICAGDELGNIYYIQLL